MEPDVEFFGVAIPPGKTIHCSEADPEEDGEDGGGADETSLVHVTQFALGPSPAPGRHTILAVRSNGSEFAVGTLEAGRVDQFSADFMWSALAPSPADGISDGGGYGAVSFRHTGASAVHLTGYKTVSSLLDYGGMSEGEEEEEESGSEEEEEEEAGADGHRRHQAARPRPRGLVRLGAPEAESDEEDEEDDDDDSSALSEDDEEDEDSLLTSSGSEEEDEEEAPRAVPLKAGRARAAAPLRKGEPAGLELSSDDGEEDEDDEDWTEEEDEDEEGLAEEEAAAAAALGGGGGGSSEEEEAAAAAAAGRRAVPPTAAKRPAPAPASPAPAKKGKAAPAAAPATPPTPAMAAAGGGGGSAAAYAAALASHLRAAGPTRVANLGSAVPRPPAAPKLMKVLTGMGDLFAVDGAGMVSLKKQ